MKNSAYTDELMKLRGQCLRSLNNYLESHTRAVFEFSTLWCENGNTNINNIEKCFRDQYNISS